MNALDARLNAVYDLTPPCDLAADIGTDHGYLGAHLLETGRCARVRFTDVSAASLQKAEALMREMGLSDRADFCLGDGAEALEGPVDAVILAGMGAETICGILSRGRAKLGTAALVLQPNVDAPLLRAYLEESGYAIADEMLARANGRFYVVISAAPGQMRLSETERVVGPVLAKKQPKELADYARARVRVGEKALRGALAGQEVWAQALQIELRVWKKVANDTDGEGSLRAD
ncbi:MAG: class I SAM-dependent methyltransferase [Clostridia bacterium]